MTETIIREVLGRRISVRVERLDFGCEVNIFGGERTHIGAVTVVDESEHMQTLKLPGHKEYLVTERWAQVLYEKLQEPVCIVAGIHYDNASREEIDLIMQELEEMLKELTKRCTD